jgi:hypothetical protein
MALIKPYDKTKAEKEAYYRSFLKKIAPFPDQLAELIGNALAVTEGADTDHILENISAFVEANHLDVNGLGGPLQQPPLVVAVTGTNGEPPNPAVAGMRKKIAMYLLAKGASPLICERHPMAVNAIIRAAVFNHLEILDLMGNKLSAESLAAALNEKPIVNGLTALHDTVLRAGTAGNDKIDGYLQQIRWLIRNGAHSDIQDFSGKTQLDYARDIADPERKTMIISYLCP